MHESVRITQGFELEVLNLHETDLDMEWRLDTGFRTKTYSNPDESIRVIKSSRLIHSNIYKTSLKDTRIGTNHKFRVLDWDP